MKTIKLLFQLALILSATSCGASGGDKNNQNQANSAEVPESASGNHTAVVDENCNRRLPLTLVQELDNTVIAVGHVVSSENSCMAEFRAAGNADAKLYMTIETETDEARLKRRIDAFRYQPGLVEEFAAGNGAVLVRTTSKHTDIIDVVFSTGMYFCVITTQMPAGTMPEKAVLFSYPQAKQLALNWAVHLKNE